MGAPDVVQRVVTGANRLARVPRVRHRESRSRRMQHEKKQAGPEQMLRSGKSDAGDRAPKATEARHAHLRNVVEILRKETNLLRASRERPRGPSKAVHRHAGWLALGMDTPLGQSNASAATRRFLGRLRRVDHGGKGPTGDSARSVDVHQGDQKVRRRHVGRSGQTIRRRPSGRDRLRPRGTAAENGAQLADEGNRPEVGFFGINYSIGDPELAVR